MILEPGSIIGIYIAPTPNFKDMSAIALSLEDMADWYQREISNDQLTYSPGYLEAYYFQTKQRLIDFREHLRIGRSAPRFKLRQLLYIPYDPVITVNPLEWLSRKMESLGYPNYAGDHVSDPSGFSFLPYGYIAFVRGLGGFAGTTGTPAQVRMTMLSDIFLDAITSQERKAYDALPTNMNNEARIMAATRDGQIGALCHEASHLLGWIEPVLGRDPHLNLPGNSVHYEWWKWPDTSLSLQKDMLSKAPWNIFFEAIS